MLYSVKLTGPQFRVLLSGSPLRLTLGEDAELSLTLDDAATLRLFKLMSETVQQLPKHLKDTSLQDLVRERLDSGAENGYYNDFKQMTPKQVADDMYAQDADIEAWADFHGGDDVDAYLEKEVVPIVKRWFEDRESQA